MKRAIVIGSPGAGKSTFARKLKDKTGLPLYYLVNRTEQRLPARNLIRNYRRFYKRIVGS